MEIYNRRIVSGIWLVIWLLIVTGLSTAIITSVNEDPRPEIIIETCSLLAALLLVIVERLSMRSAARRTLLVSVIEEMTANARKLTGDPWTKEEPLLEAEVEDTRRGLRFYYPHLATSAISAAVLSTNFDARDADLVDHLHHWQASAEECNARLTMAQLLLFFLPSDEKGMEERLSLHRSIRDLPVVRAREALASVGDYFMCLDSRLQLPADAALALKEIQRLTGDEPSCGGPFSAAA